MWTWAPCVSPALRCTLTRLAGLPKGQVLVRPTPHVPTTHPPSPGLAGIHDGIPGRNPLYDLVVSLGLLLSPRQDYGSSACGEAGATAAQEGGGQRPCESRRRASALLHTLPSVEAACMRCISLPCPPPLPCSRHILPVRPAHQPLPVRPDVRRLVRLAPAGAGAPAGRAPRRRPLICRCVR